MTESIKTIEEAFSQAMRWEAMAERFYEVAAERFAGTSQQLLLMQLAEEESSHQLDIKQMAAQAHGIAQEFVSATDLPADTDKMEEILAAGTMLEIASFALQMEKAAVANYQALADKTEGNLKDMLLQMRDFERQHVSMIEDMIRELEIDPLHDPEEIHSH